MADKSWGDPTSVGFRIRTNDSAAERAAARAWRANERAGATADRLQARSDARAVEAAARETARAARREAERSAAARDPHAAAARRPRSSGRKDIVREQRDTRGYTTTVDVDRIRLLHRRGTSVAGLAAAFGITEAEVKQALAGAE